MLVIDPSKRATMEQVKKDPWYTEGYEAESTLVTPQLNLSSEQHQRTLQEVEEIGLDKAAVEKSLADGTYDHMAATYYLTADRLFRKKAIEGDSGSPKQSQQLEQRPPPVLPSLVATSSNKQMKASAEPSLKSLAEDSPESDEAASKLKPLQTSDRPSSAARRNLTSNPTEQPSTPEDNATPRPPANKLAVRDPGAAMRRRATVSTHAKADVLKQEMLNSNQYANGNTDNFVLDNSPSVMQPLHRFDAPPGKLTGSTIDEVEVAVPKEESVESDGNSDPAQQAMKPKPPGSEKARAATFNIDTDNDSGHSLSGKSNENAVPIRKRAMTVHVPTSKPLVETVPVAPAVTESPEFSQENGEGTTGSVHGSRMKFDISGSQLSIQDKIKGTKGNKEPRTLRFTFSVGTTSSKDADEIIKEVGKVLKESGVEHRVTNYVITCYFEDIEFEIEVCKIPRLSVNGLRFKRMAGNAWNYKNLITNLISKFQLK
jgi:MAP/microtubule affinity-regulating kinase